ncbi:hypothetical protein [Microcoleus sp. herbarium2]|uniref:hypothetical protein n=1 Tax=Microcoleus sp. herbarium2 TaxID=3055433 RepID=UPI002FCF5958
MQAETCNNRSRAWNMGTLAARRNLKSGESADILTGTDWDGGIAIENRTEVSSISEPSAGTTSPTGRGFE